jgi:hypothetical protein
LSALTCANLTRWLQGNERRHDAPMSTLMFSELNLAIAQFAVEVAARQASWSMETGTFSTTGAGITSGCMPAYTIAGGSS